jgi:hypothetical protein
MVQTAVNVVSIVKVLGNMLCHVLRSADRCTMVHQEPSSLAHLVSSCVNFAPLSHVQAAATQPPWNRLQATVNGKSELDGLGAYVLGRILLSAWTTPPNNVMMSISLTLPDHSGST